MNTIDYNAHYRAGFLEGLQARGLSEKQAEFFVKQSEISALGEMDPESFRAGYDEEMQKRAAGYALVPVDDGGDDDVDESDAGDDGSFLEKLKRWGLLAGVGAGGFALGNLWPDIRTGVTKGIDAALEKINTTTQREGGETTPQNPPNQ